jgi:hypothetical protein
MRFLPCLIVLALLGTESTATAQGVSGGITGGVNFATLSFDPNQDEFDFGTRTGMVLGGFVTFPLGQHAAIQPEGLFSQKGASGEELGVKATIKLDYIEVPVLFVYSSAPPGGSGFQLFGGPSAAFKVNSKATATFEGESVDQEFDEEIKDFDFGVVFGAGVSFGKFSVNGRYNLGLTDINNDETEPVKVRTRTFSVLGAVRF